MVYFLFVIGFFALIYGAQWLIDGSRKLAKHLGVSDLIVGLTVVAFGTSLPELIVNLYAGVESGELAIGNAVGSNIANILLILGVAAVMRPLTVQRTMVYREIIFNIAAAGILAVLVGERFLSEGGFKGLDHIDGIVLMSYFAIFIYYTFGKIASNNRTRKVEVENDKQPKTLSVDFANWFFKIIAGIIGLWIGGQWIVNGAVEMAGYFGVSDALIGLTVVAIGTSLPELAATVVAVRSGSSDIAVGNVVGSNLFNIFWVLGLGAFITPLGFQDSLVIDIVINFVVALLLFAYMAFGRRKHQISHLEGYTMIMLYVIYIASVIIRG